MRSTSLVIPKTVRWFPPGFHYFSLFIRRRNCTSITRYLSFPYRVRWVIRAYINGDFSFIRCLLLSLDSPAAFSLWNSIVVDTSLESYYRPRKENMKEMPSLSQMGVRNRPKHLRLESLSPAASPTSDPDARTSRSHMPAHGRLSNEWDDRLPYYSFLFIRDLEIGFCIGIPNGLN